MKNQDDCTDSLSFCYSINGIDGAKVWHKASNPDNFVVANESHQYFGTGPVYNFNREDLLVTSVTPASPTCGYTGGCEITITADSLYGNIEAGISQVYLCDIPCIKSPNNLANTIPSNALLAYSSYKCLMPPI